MRPPSSLDRLRNGIFIRQKWSLQFFFICRIGERARKKESHIVENHPLWQFCADLCARPPPRAHVINYSDGSSPLSPCCFTDSADPCALLLPVEQSSMGDFVFPPISIGFCRFSQFGTKCFCTIFLTILLAIFGISVAAPVVGFSSKTHSLQLLTVWTSRRK